MYYQSGDFKGPVYTQRVTELPPFKKSRDWGRLITVENDSSYIGGIDGWHTFVPKDIEIYANNLQTGFNENEINAKHIPIMIPPNLEPTTVNDVLQELVINQQRIKEGKFFDEGVINYVNLNLDPTKNGMTARHILYSDLLNVFNNEPYNCTIEDVLDYLLQLKATQIPLGTSLAFRDQYSIPDGMMMSEVINFILKIADQNLQASNVKCSYYEPAPYGKTDHCIESDVQTALHSIYNTLYHHRIVDHLDVQHDWGRCGQYLGTCGINNDETDCNCANDVHLPLKFKYIKAHEIQTTVSNYMLLHGGQPEMNLQQLLFSMIDTFCSMWPVGSIFLTMNEKNPQDLLGYGCWVRLEGRFLLGWSQDKYGDVETLGGEETHVLTKKEMPSHTHNVTQYPSGAHEHVYNNGNGCGGGFHHGMSAEFSFRTPISGKHVHDIRIEPTGGDQPHNNMPPYIIVYMWKRVK